MGARRESVMDWLVLGLMMRILIGAIVVLELCFMSIDERSGRKKSNRF